jgi:hypothetical protein
MVLLHEMLVTAVPPKVIPVAPLVVLKPLPETVTVVPPATDPETGPTLLMDGGGVT